MKRIGVSILLLIFASNEIASIIADENSPESPMKIELAFSTPPALNQSAVLSCVVTSTIDAPATTIEISLPEGFTLKEGNLTWQGDIQKNERKEIQVTVAPVKTGEWMIEARARSMTGNDSWIGAREFLYVYITEEKAIVSSQKIDPYYFENLKEITIATFLLLSVIAISLTIMRKRRDKNEN